MTTARRSDLIAFGRQRSLHPRVRITTPGQSPSASDGFILEVGGSANLSAADGQLTLSLTTTETWSTFNSVGSALHAADQVTQNDPSAVHQLEIEVAGGFWIELSDTGIFGKPSPVQPRRSEPASRTG